MKTDYKFFFSRLPFFYCLIFLYSCTSTHNYATNNSLNCDRNNSVECCVRKNIIECLKARIEEGSDVNELNEQPQSPLHFAVINANLDSVKYLIKEGANINATTYMRFTPLFFALIGINEINKSKIFNKHEPYFKGYPCNYKTKEEQIELIEYLVNNGANVNDRDNEGKTPLHYAISNVPMEIVKILVINGARLNIKTDDGYTPLDYANRTLIKHMKEWAKKQPEKQAEKQKKQAEKQKLQAEKQRLQAEKQKLQAEKELIKRLTTITFSSNEPLRFSPWLNKFIDFGNNSEGYHCRNYLTSNQPFDDIQKVAQELTNKYLSLADITLPPIIPKPSMPPKLKLIQGEFESNEYFEKRIQSEIHKRSEVINTLQVDYRDNVEMRNKKINEIKKLQPQRKKTMNIQQYIFLRDAVYCVMGGFTLKNPYFEQNTGLLYFDIVAINSIYKERISIKTSGPKMTEAMYKNTNDIDSTVSLQITNEAIYLSKVELKFKNNIHVAKLMNESKKSHIAKPLEAIIDNQKEIPILKQLENIKEQNPNLVDRFQISAIIYKDGRKLETNYKDDLPSLLNKYTSVPIDKKKWLVIIGIENYKNTDNVMYSKRSAELFKKVTQKTLGISSSQTYCLIDTDATSAAIKDNLTYLIDNVKEGDIIYFYYSGHGIPVIPENEPYILPQDKVPDFVFKEDFFKLNQIYSLLSKSKASKVVAFVDSCFSGATDGKSVIKGVAASRLKPKNVNFDEDKMVVLSAGRNKQYSNMYSKRGHRLFSYFLMKSLLSGKININTIYKEVFTNVFNISRGLGDIKKQEPTIKGNRDIDL